MKIFGDDGFRDKVGSGLLSNKFLNSFFYALNFFLAKQKIKEIIIGFDTRTSHGKIIRIITKKIFAVKKIYVLEKPISTPGLQYLSKKKNLFGIMITASHFSNAFNGFKFFNKGLKLSKENEKYITKKIKDNKSFLYRKKTIKVVKLKAHLYYNYINKLLKFSFKKKIIVDCSNGSVSAFYKKIKFLSKLKPINTKTFGNKININCGSNSLSKNLKKKPYKNFEYCIAFDGDADRVLISKKKYGIIEPEKLALIFIIYFIKRKSFKSIVATEISNPWLKIQAKKFNIKVLYSKVGDRNVVQKKIKHNSLFGFETSGHFCFQNFMDGLLTAGLFIKIQNSNPEIIENVLQKKVKYLKKVYAAPILFENKIRRFLNVKNIKKIKVIIRKSIWNNFIKIYLFYKKGNSQKEFFIIKKFLRNKILKIKVKN